MTEEITLERLKRIKNDIARIERTVNREFTEFAWGVYKKCIRKAPSKPEQQITASYSGVHVKGTMKPAYTDKLGDYLDAVSFAATFESIFKNLPKVYHDIYYFKFIKGKTAIAAMTIIGEAHATYYRLLEVADALFSGQLLKAGLEYDALAAILEYVNNS